MKKRNILWLIALILLDTSLIYLMLSGNIRYFLHPKMNKFIVFSVFLLTAFALIEGYFLLKKKKSLIKDSGVWIFLLPLAFLIIFKPSAIDTNTLQNKASKVDLSNPRKLDEKIGYKKTDFDQYKDKSVYVPPAELEAKNKKHNRKDNRSEEDKKIAKKKSQKRTEDEVYKAIEEFNINKEQKSAPNHVPKVVEVNPDEIEYSRIEGEKYKDLLAKAYTSTNPKEKLTITGFAFKQDNFKENQISISRLLMTCCVADASVMGLLSDTSQIKNIELGKWYEFTGTISKTKHFDPQLKEETIVPILKVTKAKEIETPISPYVYP